MFLDTLPSLNCIQSGVFFTSAKITTKDYSLVDFKLRAELSYFIYFQGLFKWNHRSYIYDD